MLDVRQAAVTQREALAALDEVRRLEALRGSLAAVGGSLAAPDAERLERLTRVRNAAVHPQTQEVIATPLRLSMVVPANMCLDAIMLSARSPAASVAAMWLNQTYNALHYYANRNTSNPQTPTQRAAAYGAATASSAAVALYVGGGGVPALRRFAPFCAVAAADVFNLAIMRKSEFVDGVDVFDASPTASPLASDEAKIKVGVSQRAGLLATGSCIVARVAAAFPILVGTPLLMDALASKTSLFARAPWLRTPVLVATVGVMIQLAVPVTFGLFRQNMVVPTSWLEPRLRARATHVSFNKGL